MEKNTNESCLLSIHRQHSLIRNASKIPILDTIGIRSIPGEFEIKKNAPITVYPATYTLNDGEVKNDFKLFNLEGEEISGSKAILNRDQYQVTIDSRGLYIQLSVPKFLRGTNYQPANQDETREALKSLQDKLKQDGISLDVNSMIPGRLDACKNIKTKLTTGNYFSFLHSLGGSRMNQKSNYNDGIKRTGYQWQNSQQEIICYDKRLEMESREEEIKDIPKNVLRFEHRLRRGRKIKSSLGFNTVRDLVKEFPLIEENYNQTMRDSIFKYEPNDKRLFQSKTIADYLEHSLTNYSRNKYLKFAVNILFSKEGFLIDEMSLFETLDLVMDKLEYSNEKKRKQRFLLKQMLSNTKDISSDLETVNVRDLYRELREKILKVA